jgi:hypothetical protein
MSEVIVRPIYNLLGMGVGANIIPVDHHLPTKMPPGTFWCEVFEGVQLSTTFRWSSCGWTVESCYEAVNPYFTNINGVSQQIISYWRRVPSTIVLPSFVDGLRDVETINIESIGHKIIEIHLRGNPDPIADEFIPVYVGDDEFVKFYTEQGYSYTEDPDDANGFMPCPRTGFMIR